MRYRATISILLMLFVSSVDPANAIEWNVPVADGSYSGVGFAEALPDTGWSTSRILANYDPPKDKAGQGASYLCKDATEPICRSAPWMHANIVFPPCMSETQKVCIQNLELASREGNLENAVLDHEVASVRTPADNASGLPAGGGYSVWKSPNVKNAAGEDTYAAIVRANYVLNKQTNTFEIQTFNAYVVPVKMITGSFCLFEYYSVAKDDLYGEPNVGTRYAGQNCDGSKSLDQLWSEKGAYGQAADFSPNTTVALTLRMNNDLTGWLAGRMKDVRVEVTPIDKNNNKIRVEAKPLEIPAANGVFKKTEITKYPDLYKYYSNNRWLGYATYENWLSQLITYGTYLGVDGFDIFNLIEPLIKPVSDGTRWYFSSDKNSQFVAINGGNNASGKCFADKTKLLGLVTTNAMIYEAGPPDFKDGFLTYRVAGLHTLPDGSLFKGTYDLALRSETARCIYGFSMAPIMSSVSIIATDGSIANVATEVVREANGWMTLTARNFTFSAPTIRIKLSQDGPITAVVPSVGAKKTITCTKGKLVKKVTAVKPVCPKGYNKK
ncbi:MAG: hypothetical protein F2804_02850 [Actinobacteria bacterium]|nr:hypothetical protein [Actinomycetota bacterium]